MDVGVHTRWMAHIIVCQLNPIGGENQQRQTFTFRTVKLMSIPIFI